MDSTCELMQYGRGFESCAYLYKKPLNWKTAENNSIQIKFLSLYLRLNILRSLFEKFTLLAVKFEGRRRGSAFLKIKQVVSLALNTVLCRMVFRYETRGPLETDNHSFGIWPESQKSDRAWELTST